MSESGVTVRYEDQPTKDVSSEEQEREVQRLERDLSRYSKAVTKCQWCLQEFPPGKLHAVVTEHRATCKKNPDRRKLVCKQCGFHTHHYQTFKSHCKREHEDIWEELFQHAKNAWNNRVPVEPPPAPAPPPLPAVRQKRLPPAVKPAAVKRNRSEVPPPPPKEDLSCKGVLPGPSGAGHRSFHTSGEKEPLGSVPSASVDVIYADPPWLYGSGNNGQGSLGGLAENQYSCMTQKELKDLGTHVKRVAKRNSICFMWTSGSLMTKSLEVLASWGFEYKTKFLLWVKTKKSDPSKEHVMGLGWWSMPASEEIIVGVRGASKDLVSRENRPSQILMAPKGRHSQKPEEARQRVEQMLTTGTRLQMLEMFARRMPDPASVLHNWWIWGNDDSLRDAQESLGAEESSEDEPGESPVTRVPAPRRRRLRRRDHGDEKLNHGLCVVEFLYSRKRHRHADAGVVPTGVVPDARLVEGS